MDIPVQGSRIKWVQKSDEKGCNKNIVPNKNMIKKLKQIEQKLDLIISEITGLKTRLDKHTPMPRDKPLSVKEAADYLQLSASRIYNLIFEKKLLPNQRTKRCRITFSIEALNNYLNQSNETEFQKK